MSRRLRSISNNELLLISGGKSNSSSNPPNIEIHSAYAGNSSSGTAIMAPINDNMSVGPSIYTSGGHVTGGGIEVKFTW
jgi:hypothetical protein